MDEMDFMGSGRDKIEPDKPAEAPDLNINDTLDAADTPDTMAAPGACPQATPTVCGLDLSLYEEQDRLCMIYGSIGQGKTTLLQAIIKTLCEAGIFEWGIVFCQSSFNKKDYTWMPKQCVHEWGDGSKYLKVCEKIKKAAKRGVELKRGFCILDDVGYQMNKIAYKQGDMSGNQNMIILRHLKLSHFLTSQYYTTSTPLTRELCDLGCFFNTGYQNSAKAYHRIAGGWFPRFRDFYEFLQKMTREKYTALVYYNRKRSADEAYVSFKCDVPEPWRCTFCSPV